MDRDVDAELRLAGYALAHAMWSIEDGETLCTLAFVELGESRELFRYEARSIPESVEMARQHLAGVVLGDVRAILVFDGYARTEDGRRSDALAAEIVGPGANPIGHVLQPYRPRTQSRFPFRRRVTSFALRGDPFMSAGIDTSEARGAVRAGFLTHDQGPRILAAPQSD